MSWGSRIGCVTTRPYPWSTLERVPRRALRRLAELREQPATFVPEDIAGVLTALIGGRVEIVLAGLAVGGPADRLVEIGLAWGDSRVTIGAEVALVSALLERILARPFALARPDPGLEPSIVGAFTALAVEVARRVSNEPVTLAAPLAAKDDTLCALVHVHLEDRTFAAYALASAEPRATRDAKRPRLGALGDLPLAVPLVVAASLITRDELRRLAPGTAFVPEPGAWVNVRGVGRGALVAPTSERGVWVELTPDSRLVLRGGTVELSQDAADSGDGMSEQDDVNRTLVDAALEAPVVVRVELGVVSLSAGDWAKLRPGDVLETGRRIAEPVILRVAGRAVARGELVDVDGEVGVRVRELFGGKAED
jgi:type III secretion system YscQ/HrcQ family protein